MEKSRKLSQFKTHSCFCFILKRNSSSWNRKSSGPSGSLSCSEGSTLAAISISTRCFCSRSGFSAGCALSHSELPTRCSSSKSSFWLAIFPPSIWINDSVVGSPLIGLVYFGSKVTCSCYSLKIFLDSKSRT